MSFIQLVHQTAVYTFGRNVSTNSTWVISIDCMWILNIALKYITLKQLCGKLDEKY